MKICFFGIFDQNYSRNNILIKGFIDNGHDVVFCKVDPKIVKGFYKYIQLYKEYKNISDINFDFIFVGFPGHTVVWLAKILFRKIIVFDAFVSLYNSNVDDRSLYSKFSLSAFKDWFLDFYSCHLADFICLDTDSHIKYFSNKYYLNKSKFIKVLVGSNEEIFFPRNREKNSKIFTVHFHGSFLPLQGVRFIVGAAVILKNENILFRFVGDKRLHDYISTEIKKYSLNNIELISRVPYVDLPKEIEKSDICLGIFGINQKAKMVIPNKVYEGVAMGMPVITMESDAIKEVFTDKLNILLCKSGDSQSIASAIMELKNNQDLFQKISRNASKLFKNELRPKTIVQNILYKLQ